MTLRTRVFVEWFVQQEFIRKREQFVKCLQEGRKKDPSVSIICYANSVDPSKFATESETSLLNGTTGDVREEIWQSLKKRSGDDDFLIFGDFRTFESAHGCTILFWASSIAAHTDLDTDII